MVATLRVITARLACNVNDRVDLYKIIFADLSLLQLTKRV